MDTPERLIHHADQYDAWLRDTIRRCGWALQAVFDDGEESPPFVYTVGLSGYEHPELVLFGTSQTVAATMLNDLGELVRRGRVLTAGETLDLPAGRVQLLSFPASDGWLFAANQLYRRAEGPPVPALLVIVEDDPGAEPEEEQRCPCCPP